MEELKPKPKFCTVCKKPLRTRNHGLCRSCRLHRQLKKAEKTRAEKEEERRQKALAARTSQMLLQAGDKYADVVAVCDEMMELHGGIKNFCEEWKNQLDIAICNSPGSKIVLSYYRDLVHLHMKAAEHRPANTDIDTMDLEDVSAEVAKMADEMGLRLHGEEDDEEAA